MDSIGAEWNYVMHHFIHLTGGSLHPPGSIDSIWKIRTLPLCLPVGWSDGSHLNAGDTFQRGFSHFQEVGCPHPEQKLMYKFPDSFMCFCFWLQLLSCQGNWDETCNFTGGQGARGISGCDFCCGGGRSLDIWQDLRQCRTKFGWWSWIGGRKYPVLSENAHLWFMCICYSSPWVCAILCYVRLCSWYVIWICRLAGISDFSGWICRWVDQWSGRRGSWAQFITVHNPTEFVWIHYCPGTPFDSSKSPPIPVRHRPFSSEFMVLWWGWTGPLGALLITPLSCNHCMECGWLRLACIKEWHCSIVPWAEQLSCIHVDNRQWPWVGECTSQLWF